MSQSIRIYFVLFFALSGCASSVVQLDEKLNNLNHPSYEDYFDGYLLGLLGTDRKVDLSRVCMDQKPYGFQKTVSGGDIFFAVLTLGIYTPTTVRVWCGE